MTEAPGEPPIRLHAVGPDDWEAHRTIRLEMLLDAPDAFWFTHADVVGFTEADWRKDVERAFLVQARRGDEVVGSAGLGSHDPERPRSAILFGMYVSPQARGAGVGERLVHAVLEEARRQGQDEVLLDVTNTNAAAIRLYERCGFVRTGRIQPHPRRAELHEFEMVRSLA